jgi:hypothetical protein
MNLRTGRYYSITGGGYEYEPYVRDHNGAFGNEITVIDIIIPEGVRYTYRGNDMIAQDLLEDSFSIGQLSYIRQNWQTLRTKNGVDFCLCPSLNLWIEGQ